ncbi:MAG: CarD family transcriptional regulator [Acidobacteriota bacterium]
MDDKIKFKIGDKVIYPNQGISVIEEIIEKSIGDQTAKCYHLRVLSNCSSVLVPISNVHEVGLRKLSSRSDINSLFGFFEDDNINFNSDWKERYKIHENMMRTGLLFDIASVLKNLYYLSLIKPLSFREKKMMEKAKFLLASEISEVNNCKIKYAEEKIESILYNTFKSKIPKQNF